MKSCTSATRCSSSAAWSTARHRSSQAASSTCSTGTMRSTSGARSMPVKRVSASGISSTMNACIGPGLALSVGRVNGPQKVMRASGTRSLPAAGASPGATSSAWPCRYHSSAQVGAAGNWL